MPMRRSRSRTARTLIFSLPPAVVAALALGCSVPPEEEGFHSPSPQARARAVGAVVAEDDRDAIPHLITMLGSDDPAQRMLAIRALEQMTGQTLGYLHNDPEPRREQAIASWVAWWNDAQPETTTPPASSTPPEPGSVAPAAAMADHLGADDAIGPPSGNRPADQER